MADLWLVRPFLSLAAPSEKAMALYPEGPSSARKWGKTSVSR